MARGSRVLTVQDVTDAFLRARERGAWPVQAVVDALPGSSASAFAGLRCEWDQPAGEEWVRLLKTSMVLALLWVPGPLVIATTGHHDIDDEIERVTGLAVEQVNVAHIDSPVLSLRVDVVGRIWPARDWPTGAIDPAALSAHDLWYATS
jgi:hypothetical protein